MARNEIIIGKAKKLGTEVITYSLQQLKENQKADNDVNDQYWTAKTIYLPEQSGFYSATLFQIKDGPYPIDAKGELNLKSQCSFKCRAKSTNEEHDSAISVEIKNDQLEMWVERVNNGLSVFVGGLGEDVESIITNPKENLMLNKLSKALKKTLDLKMQPEQIEEIPAFAIFS